MWTYNNTDELYHYGVIGMKWGRRRYQNKDGSLTAAGRRKQEKIESKLEKNIARQTKHDNKLLNARAKNRARWEAKYDKKIAKKADNANAVKKLETKKKKFLDAYDNDTTYVKRAMNVVNGNHNRILELKAKSISDPSIIKSKEYKQAKKWASSQAWSDFALGKANTLLWEASYQATYKDKSFTRGKTKQ